MKILILGGSGMLGHRLWSSLGAHHNVYGTIRNSRETFPKNIPNIDFNKIIDNLDVNNFLKLEETISLNSFDVVINCIGIIKNIDEGKNHIISISLNSLLPHKLAKLCKKNNARFIHFSTDCVFDGKIGGYNESDLENATDLYGKTKALGEVNYLDNSLTLRTSIIGRELSGHRSLVDWFLSQERTVKGFKEAVFSGYPTHTVAKVLKDFILPNEGLHGLYHLSADPINKFDLLLMIKTLYEKDIDIVPDVDFIMKRNLDSSQLRSKVGDYPQKWIEIINDLKVDHKIYNN